MHEQQTTLYADAVAPLIELTMQVCTRAYRPILHQCHTRKILFNSNLCVKKVNIKEERKKMRRKKGKKNVK